MEIPNLLYCFATIAHTIWNFVKLLKRSVDGGCLLTQAIFYCKYLTNGWALEVPNYPMWNLVDCHQCIWDIWPLATTLIRTIRKMPCKRLWDFVFFHHLFTLNACGTYLWSDFRMRMLSEIAGGEIVCTFPLFAIRWMKFIEWNWFWCCLMNLCENSR